MKPVVKEFKNMKYVDFNQLDTFEAVSIGTVYVLAVSVGLFLGSLYFS